MQNIPEETITRAAQGDISAFEEIYKNTSVFVYNVAWRMLHSREDAQEIAQDVFTTVFKKLKDFRFESSLKTWLYRITVNLSINRLKKMNKERNANISFDDAIKNPEIEENLRIDQNASIDADQEKLLNSLLACLNPDQKACIILRNIEGLSYQEIANSLKIKINTVRSRLKRARDIMKSHKNINLSLKQQ